MKRCYAPIPFLDGQLASDNITFSSALRILECSVLRSVLSVSAGGGGPTPRPIEECAPPSSRESQSHGGLNNQIVTSPHRCTRTPFRIAFNHRVTWKHPDNWRRLAGAVGGVGTPPRVSLYGTLLEPPASSRGSLELLLLLRFFSWLNQPRDLTDSAFHSITNPTIKEEACKPISKSSRTRALRRPSLHCSRSGSSPELLSLATSNQRTRPTTPPTYHHLPQHKYPRPPPSALQNHVWIARRTMSLPRPSVLGSSNRVHR